MMSCWRSLLVALITATSVSVVVVVVAVSAASDGFVSTECLNQRQCRGQNISCNSNSSCVVNCIGSYSCENIREIQEENSFLQVNCLGTLSCVGIKYCDKTQRNCTHNCAGFCSCTNPICKTDAWGFSLRSTCEIDPNWRSIGNLRCRVLADAVRLTPPPENVGLVLPLAFQLLFAKDVLPLDPVQAEKNMRDILSVTDAWKMISSTFQVNVTFALYSGRIILYKVTDETADSVFAQSLEHFLMVAFNKSDSPVTVLETYASMRDGITVVSISHEIHKGFNSFFVTSAFSLFLAEIFPVRVEDIVTDFITLPSGVSNLTVRLPSNCTLPRPFFFPRCRWNGAWVADEQTTNIMLPDIVATRSPVIVNTLRVTSHIEVTSSILADNISIGNTSIVEVGHTTQITAKCVILDGGTLLLTNMSENELKNGFTVIDSIDTTCSGGKFTQINWITDNNKLIQNDPCLRADFKSNKLLVFNICQSDTLDRKHIIIIVVTVVTISLVILIGLLFHFVKPFRQFIAPFRDKAFYVRQVEQVDVKQQTDS